MKISENNNYTILCNEATPNFFNKFLPKMIIDSTCSYSELRDKIMLSNDKQIVFNEALYNLRYEEKMDIMELLRVKNIKFINVTSNIEDALLGDNIIVYNGTKIVLEGPKEKVLKEEKILKRLGYGLPFVVDLSTQLQFYDILDKTYYDMESLAGELWN